MIPKTITLAALLLCCSSIFGQLDPERREDATCIQLAWLNKTQLLSKHPSRFDEQLSTSINSYLQAVEQLAEAGDAHAQLVVHTHAIRVSPCNLHTLKLIFMEAPFPENEKELPEELQERLKSYAFRFEAQEKLDAVQVLSFVSDEPLHINRIGRDISFFHRIFSMEVPMQQEGAEQTVELLLEESQKPRLRYLLAVSSCPSPCKEFLYWDFEIDEEEEKASFLAEGKV